jgi:hypothetical protein
MDPPDSQKSARDLIQALICVALLALVLIVASKTAGEDVAVDAQPKSGVGYVEPAERAQVDPE